MFHATWTTPCDAFAGTLRFTVDPRRCGLGHYTDVDGVQWDIRGLIGEYIQARRVGYHPDYYSTASWSNQNGTHTWNPYKVEIVSTDSGHGPTSAGR